jgi:hypothetical protein
MFRLAAPLAARSLAVRLPAFSMRSFATVQVCYCTEIVLAAAAPAPVEACAFFSVRAAVLRGKAANWRCCWRCDRAGGAVLHLGC